jgi:hypothetical protein
MKVRHGHCKVNARTKEWGAWNAMHRRCKYPSMDRYEKYGGRGITICERWNNFLNFLEDVGYAPSKTHSLGRIDNDGNYEPSNVRWETVQQQHRNTSGNRKITFNEKTLTLCEWAELTGIKRTTITQRLDAYGWSVEATLTTPTKCKPILK